MKQKLGSIPYIYPIPIALVGANVDGKPNFVTVGDVGILGIRIPIVMISLNDTHYTTKGIFENETFTINFPNTKMLEVTDHCGIVSGKNVDKSALFDVFYGDLKSAPMIEECPVCLECKMVKEFNIDIRQMFVGEVVQTYIDEQYVSEKNGHKVVASMPELDPIIYALDNTYYKIGEPIGKGYHAGKDYGKK